MDTTTTQRRAKAGGEYGANGDWYEGGKFIATEEDTIKRAPMRHEVTPEEAARRAARDEENRITAARVQAWLTERRARFADVIARLTANPGHDPKWWAELLANGQAGFHASLGVQLRDGGSLSARQAEYVAKAIFGRCNRKNAEAWDALVSGLVEDFK
jgi:hypothetical protein